MALPSAWIDRIFERLELTYGHRFLSQWPAMAPDRVKAHWAEELDGMERHADAIGWALKHLPPDEPVNVLQFIALCRRAPAKPQPSLPAPAANPERVQRAIAGITRHREPIDRLAPLRQLHHWDMHNGGRMANGKLITLAQRATYRQALGLDSKVPNTTPQEA